ncbi:MAG: REP-associated tyrosine transposase [Armatimonadota bacterium]
MTRWHNQYSDGCMHFCTFTVRDWKPSLNKDIVNALYEEWDKARQRFSVQIIAYVIMPEHIHLLIRSQHSENIKLFLQRTKGQISKRFKSIDGSFWKEQPRVYPVYSESVIRQKIEYIHNNPVKRGLVGDSSEWMHSSFNQLVMADSNVPFVCDVFPEGR